MPNNTDKSLKQWLWDAACSIRGAKDAPKYKDYILPPVFAKRPNLGQLDGSAGGWAEQSSHICML